MDKQTLIRAVIAALLSSLFFLAWNVYVMPPKPVDNPPVTQQENVTPQIAQDQPATIVTPESSPVARALNVPPLEIDNGKVTLGFDTVTGDIRFADMTGYKMGNGLSPRFNRASNKTKNYFTINTGIESGYTLNEEKLRDGSTQLTFTAKSNQLIITKQYIVSNDTYVTPFNISIQNISNSTLNIPLTVVIGPELGEGFDDQKYIFTGPMIYADKILKKEDADDVKKPITLSNPQWGGYTSKYFLFALMKGSFEKAEMISEGKSAIVQFSRMLTITPGSTVEISDASLFTGPKYYNDLKSYDIGMHKSIDFGIFSFLVLPMTKILQFNYKIVHNYGIAIIILTIFIKLLTLPLTLKSMMSMKAMTKLQPEMTKIREKFKDEPQKMNAAMMELYKKHKANPLSGCLPMFVQIPIFFALYKALLVSIELKGAPFFGWIVDLSVKDPYYITPVLMGATMFVVQKMTPSTMEPMQQKILLLMPVVFTVMFINFPAGLVVYWLTNNVLSIVQQYIINKKK